MMPCLRPIMYTQVTKMAIWLLEITHLCGCKCFHLFFDTNKWKIELCLLKSQNIGEMNWRCGNNWIFLLWGVQRVLGRYCVLSSVSHNELVVIGLLNNETSVIEFINSRRFMSNEQWVAPDSVRANDNPDMSLDNLLKLWLRIPGTMRLKNDQISMQQY